MLIRTLLFLTPVFVAGLSGCGSASKATREFPSGYDLENPAQVLYLPDTLREISGLTTIDDSTVACVQDENGILFIYDLTSNRIRRQYPFHADGDYEGITRVGKTIYVLRSDGILYEIPDYKADDQQLVSYDTGIPSSNNEGLCYDAARNRLLIAAKGKPGKGKELKDNRVIYSFDLETRKLGDTPAYQFNVKNVKKQAAEQYVDLPVRSKKDGEITAPVLRFTTSAICIHPVSGKLYLLSSTDHLLFVIGKGGEIEYIEPLDPDLFNKAEGITFLSNGDMLISNEGQDKRPTLIRFVYKNKHSD